MIPGATRSGRSPVDPRPVILYVAALGTRRENIGAKFVLILSLSITVIVFSQAEAILITSLGAQEAKTRIGFC